MPLLLDAQQPEAIGRAAQRLVEGGLVGLPTETVYGLAADADNASAVRRVFEAKGRPAEHPLIVHVAAESPRSAIERYAREVPAFAERLIAAGWPGPLTLILPRRAEAAAVAAGGQDSVGLRCPSHPVAQAVLRAAAARGVHGVAAPSANRFGRVSPTTAGHVMDEFAALGEDELLVLDGGACPVGIESTIVDCTRGHPVLLRPGVLTPARLEAIAGEPLRAADGGAPRASGTLESHYAPRAKVRLMDAKQLRAAFQVLGSDAKHIALYARSPIDTARGAPRRRMPDHAEAAAQELFAVLRELDATGVRLIWVETPPDGPEWDGVRDRLRRAAA